MSERSHVCEAGRYLWKGLPAIGCYTHPLGYRVWLCDPCSIRLGYDFSMKGYKWEPLREPPPAQPPSERVEP